MYMHIYIYRCAHTYTYVYVYIYTCVCLYMYKYLFTYIHRKSSLYLPLGSVKLVLKAMGTPDEISSNHDSPRCPRNFNTKLTEPTRQIKTTFFMNMYPVFQAQL